MRKNLIPICEQNLLRSLLELWGLLEYEHRGLLSALSVIKRSYAGCGIELEVWLNYDCEDKRLLHSVAGVSGYLFHDLNVDTPYSLKRLLVD